MGFNISLNLIDSNLSNPLIKGSDSFNFFSYSFLDNEIFQNLNMRDIRDYFPKIFKYNSVKLNFKDKNLLFLISINILPIFLMLLTSMITGSKIRTMWMTPFYLFFGTLIIYVFQKEISKINFKKF